MKLKAAGVALEYWAEPEPNVIDRMGVSCNVPVSLHKPADSKKGKRKRNNRDHNENSSQLYTYEFHNFDRWNQSCICKFYCWRIVHYSDMEDYM